MFINLSNILKWVNGGKIDISPLTNYLAWYRYFKTKRRVILVLWAQTLPSKWNNSVMQLFAVVSKMPTLTCNRASNFIIKNAIILNIMHNICKNCNNALLCFNSSLLDCTRWHTVVHLGISVVRTHNISCIGPHLVETNILWRDQYKNSQLMSLLLIIWFICHNNDLKRSKYKFLCQIIIKGNSH